MWQYLVGFFLGLVFCFAIVDLTRVIVDRQSRYRAIRQMRMRQRRIDKKTKAKGAGK